MTGEPPERLDASAIIRGVFEIFGVLSEMARDLAAIRLLLEDDGEEDQDG